MVHEATDEAYQLAELHHGAAHDKVELLLDVLTTAVQRTYIRQPKGLGDRCGLSGGRTGGEDRHSRQPHRESP